jgi:hypothetical protein
LKIEPSTDDEYGEKSSLVTIAKASSIFNFIDKLQRTVTDPTSSKKKPIFMFPCNDSYGYDAKKFVSELCSISRIPNDDHRTSIEFNHTPDTLMSLIYAITALKINSKWDLVGHT